VTFVASVEFKIKCEKCGNEHVIPAQDVKMPVPLIKKMFEKIGKGAGKFSLFLKTAGNGWEKI